MIRAFWAVYGSLFHTTRHSERSGATHVDTLGLPSTRHPEALAEGATHVGTFDNNHRAAFTLAEGATQRICTRVSEAKLVPKTTLLRAVQIQDRRHIRFCIAFNSCKILKQVQDDSTPYVVTLGFARILERVTHFLTNLFHTTRHSERSGATHVDTLGLPSTRHPEALAEGATHVGTFDNNHRAAFTLAEGATHVSMSNNNHHAAFTLAEVLITLGIIGVVAALTIPSLIYKYQTAVLESQFKKQYSQLSQALMMMYRDKGVALTPKNLPRYAFSDYFKSYFNVIKDCGNVNINTKGCITYSPSEDNVYNMTLYKSYTGSSINFGFMDDGALILKDGTTLMFEQGSQAEVVGYFLIGIDVNGFMKGPNRFGHDVFVFKVDASGNLMRTKDTMVREICDKNSTSDLNGYGCAIYALTQKDYFKNLPKT